MVVRLQVLLLLAVIALPASAQEMYRPTRAPDSPDGIPFQCWFTKDAFGRRITFYLGTESVAHARVPIVVFILGSGAHSNFIERNGTILDGHRALREVLAGRGRLLIVEKPGVKFLSQPERNGTAIGASEEFLREHTLERWSEAVSAAIEAALSLPAVSPSHVLVAGHSEGSRTAFRVAARNPHVTHVAGLAGFTTSVLRCFVIDESWGRREFDSIEPGDRYEQEMERNINQF